MFTHVIKNSLNKNECERIIDFYKKSNKKRHGIVGIEEKIDLNTKVGMELYLNEHLDESEAQIITDMLSKRLSKGLLEYNRRIDETFKNFNPGNWFSCHGGFYDTGYKIQFTEPGGFFNWHTDFAPSDKRFITFIWYLNDVKEEDGGSTDMIDGTRIIPETGKLLFFPATWTCVHRGNVLKRGEKYIVTGWLHYN